MTTHLRHALRALRKSPGFTAVAVATLALGIGANSAIFTLVNAVLFRPAQVAEPERMVEIYTREDQNLYSTSSYPDYADLRDRATVFDGVIHYRLNSMTLTADQGRLVLWTEIVSGNYFQVLGIRPAAGRFFHPAEEDVRGAPSTVVLSHQFWERQFQRDPGIVGRTIRLNGQPFTVVGVAPASFTGMVRGMVPSVWVTVASTERTYGNPGILEGRANRGGWNKARLRPGATLEAARTEVAAIGRGLAETWPLTNAGREFTVVASTSVTVHPSVDGMLAAGAAVLLAVPAVVLLIACANLATLLLARAAGRRREVAVRLALGATRGQLVRQLLAEQMVLALLGGLVGLLLSAWLVRLLVVFRPPLPVPLSLDLAVDARVAAFTLGIALLTGLAVGLAPALRGSRVDLVPDLREGASGGRRGSRLRALLVAGQLALSMVLLLGAGLLVRSVGQAAEIDRGFDGSRTAVVAFDMQQSGVSADRGAAFYRDLESRVAALPGVTAVAFAHRLPLQLNYESTSLLVEGEIRPPDAPAWTVPVAWVSPQYFTAIGTPVVRGRAFAETDRADGPGVAIVSEAAARRFWPGQDPIGRVVRRTAGGPAFEVVGVARDSKVMTLGEEPRPKVYFSTTQAYRPDLHLLVRVTGDPAAILPSLRTLVRELDPEVGFTDLTTVNAQLAIALFPLRFTAGLLSALGVAGLLIAAIGLYGIIAHGVAQRTRELGIRLALGANAGRVAGLVLREGMVMVAAGSAVGLGLAALATRALRAWLYGVSPTDPVTFLAVPLGFALVAALACWIPARRATRVDPMVALRAE